MNVKIEKKHTANFTFEEMGILLLLGLELVKNSDISDRVEDMKAETQI